jgi:hypothetical protein
VDARTRIIFLSPRLRVLQSAIRFAGIRTRRPPSYDFHQNDVRLYPLSLYFQFPQLSSGLGSKFFGRRYETIATTFQSFYVTGFFSGILKSFSQLTQRGVQTIIEIYKCINGPEPLSQALAAYQLATLLQKGNQNLEGLVLQTNSSAVSSQFACFQGNFKRTKPVPT